MVRQESKHHHRIFGGEDASALHRLHQLFGLDGRSFPPMHCHEDLAEILLILRGHGRCTVDFGGRGL